MKLLFLPLIFSATLFASEIQLPVGSSITIGSHHIYCGPQGVTPTPDILGVWYSKFAPGSSNISATYRFLSDGTVIREDAPNYTAYYSFSQGELTIQWPKAKNVCTQTSPTVFNCWYDTGTTTGAFELVREKP